MLFMVYGNQETVVRVENHHALLPEYILIDANRTRNNTIKEKLM